MDGTDACLWFGVTCTGSKVRQLDLENNNIVGTLPSQIVSSNLMTNDDTIDDDHDD